MVKFKTGFEALPEDLQLSAHYQGAFAGAMYATGLVVHQVKELYGLPSPIIMGRNFRSFIPVNLTIKEIEAQAAAVGRDTCFGWAMRQANKDAHQDELKSWIRLSKLYLGDVD